MTLPHSIGGNVDAQKLNDNFSYLDSEKVGKANLHVANVKDFGAKGDGVTDDTAAFNAAMDDLAANGGGRLFIPEGTYVVNLNIGYDLVGGQMRNHDNIIVQGVGPKTVLTLPSSMQSVGGELIAIRGQDATTKVRNVTIRDLKIQNYENDPNPGNGIGVTKAENIFIQNVIVDSCTNNGITVESENENITIENVIATNNTKMGIALTSSSTRRVRVINCITNNNAMHGLYFSYNTGTTMEELSVVGITSRFNTLCGIWGSHFDHSHIIGGIISNNGQEGILLQNQKGSKIIGVSVQNNGYEGIRLSGVTGAAIIGCDVIDNTGAGSTHYGIRIHNVSADCIVMGNTIGNVNTTNQTNGIRIDANGCVIQANTNKTNSSTGVSIGSGFSAIIDGIMFDANISGSTPSNNDRRKYKGTAPPTSGTFKRGDIIENLLPSAGGYAGWICVADGSPGTWKGFGAIEA